MAMANDVMTLRTFVMQSDEDDILLHFPNHRSTYIGNVQAETHMSGYTKTKYIRHCLIPANVTIFRLGEVAQVVIKAVLNTIQSGHEKGSCFGRNISVDTITFRGGDISTAIIHGFEPATNQNKQMDYNGINLLLDFMLQHFAVNPNHQPQEMTHFRNLLQNSQGNELHIKNHFALWGYKSRQDFIFQLDNMSEDWKNTDKFINRMCYHVEKYTFNTPSRAGKLRKRDNYFDFKFYIEKNSVLYEHLDIKQRNYDSLFRFMQNLLHHGRYFYGEFFTTQNLEYLLHASFPFAIEQLCIHFSTYHVIDRFWSILAS